MSAIIRRNTVQNGIEIKFNGRPDDSVISALKSKGFRWAKAGHWYIKYNDSLWQWVNDTYGSDTDMTKPVATPQYKTNRYRLITNNSLTSTGRVPVYLLKEEINAGKLEYATYKGFDGMTDSSYYISDKEQKWQLANLNDDNYDIQRIRKNDVNNHWVNAIHLSDDGTITVGSIRFRYKKDVEGWDYNPKAEMEKVKAKADEILAKKFPYSEAEFYVPLNRKAQKGQSVKGDYLTANESTEVGTRVITTQNGYEYHGTIVKLAVIEWTSTSYSFFGSNNTPTKTTTRNYDAIIKLDNGQIMRERTYKLEQGIEKPLWNNIKIIGDSHPFDFWEALLRNVVYYYDKKKDEANAKKLENIKAHAKKAEMYADKIKESKADWIHFENQSDNHLVFARMITGESELEQAIRQILWKAQLSDDDRKRLSELKELWSKGEKTLTQSNTAPGPEDTQKVVDRISKGMSADTDFINTFLASDAQNGELYFKENYKNKWDEWAKINILNNKADEVAIYKWIQENESFRQSVRNELWAILQSKRPVKQDKAVTFFNKKFEFVANDELEKLIYKNEVAVKEAETNDEVYRLDAYRKEIVSEMIARQMSKFGEGDTVMYHDEPHTITGIIGFSAKSGFYYSLNNDKTHKAQINIPEDELEEIQSTTSITATKKIATSQADIEQFDKDNQGNIEKLVLIAADGIESSIYLKNPRFEKPSQIDTFLSENFTMPDTGVFYFDVYLKEPKTVLHSVQLFFSKKTGYNPFEINFFKFINKVYQNGGLHTIETQKYEIEVYNKLKNDKYQFLINSPSETFKSAQNDAKFDKYIMNYLHNSLPESVRTVEFKGIVNKVTINLKNQLLAEEKQKGNNFKEFWDTPSVSPTSKIDALPSRKVYSHLHPEFEHLADEGVLNHMIWILNERWQSKSPKQSMQLEADRKRVFSEMLYRKLHQYKIGDKVLITESSYGDTIYSVDEVTGYILNVGFTYNLKAKDVVRLDIPDSMLKKADTNKVMSDPKKETKDLIEGLTLSLGYLSGKDYDETKELIEGLELSLKYI